jgi:hypothetical protein
MKKNIMKKFFEITLISLLFLGCLGSESETTTPPATVPSTDAPASFEVTGLRVVPANPAVGDTVTILVDVRNTGDATGTHTLLVIIGNRSQTQSIELEGKSSKTVEFEAIMDTEGTIEISTGNITKTIVVGGEEIPAPTTSAPTPAPSTPAPTTSAPTPKPTAAPEEENRLDRPAYALGTRLNYLFTVGGNEWGCSVVYNTRYEENRTPWFQWGVTDFWNPTPTETYLRGDYTYKYTRGWDLEELYSNAIGGKTALRFYGIEYLSPLPSPFPLVKGAEIRDTGGFTFTVPKYSFACFFVSGPEGRGTYERIIYTEDFEEMEAGGETYRCAKVRFFMRHTVEFSAPSYNEDWGKTEWIEEGYHWYAEEVGLVKADVTIKTYWWDELEKTDTILIDLTAAILP